MSGGRRGRPRRSATTSCCAPGSPCTARPGGPATCCGSRTRTRPPRRAAGRDADDTDGVGRVAGRTVAWLADENWGRGDRPHGRPPNRAVAPGIVLLDGEIELAAGADPADDPTLVLTAAVAAARLGVPHRPRSLDRLAAGRRGLAGQLAGRRADEARRAAARGPPGDPGARGARPARALRPAAARVGAGAVEAAAQRLPPLHRRPSPVGGGRQRRRARRPRRPARPARARRPAPRHRQGLPGRPHRGRHGDRARARAPARIRRRATSTRWWRWSSTTCCCPTSRCAATSPTRRRSSRSPTRSATVERARPAPRAHGGRLDGDRPVGVGVVEGGARRRPRRPGSARARRRRRRAR